MRERSESLRRVRVLLPQPPCDLLDYALPDGMEALPGSIVLVTLNRRPVTGVVWDAPPDLAVPDAKLKPVLEVLPGFGFAAPLRRFIDWVAAYTLAAPGSVLAMALRPQALVPDPPAMGLRRNGAEPARPIPARLTPARQAVLEAVGQGVLPAAALAQAAGVSAGIVRAMRLAGLLEPAPLAAAVAVPGVFRPAELTDEQADAARALCAAVAARAYGVTLLQGATGSGKTEVYFAAVRECLEQGRQALILLPEIALSSQWKQRFAARFGTEAASWHSDLGPRVRRATWRGAAGGEASVVVGARSALFLPFRDLGLIVVDEEHESSFKQEDGVIYHARDMAVVRARLEDAALVLVSATPSLESLTNAETGRYALLDLPSRFGAAGLPQVRAIDLRADRPERGSFLSPGLVEAMQQTLARGEQAMLFLNRRGYAPLTLCRACGHRMHCPHCSAWLVEHRLRRILTCHHCGHAVPIPPACPACGATDSLAPIGPGVERITEEAARLFPDARRLIMSSDTLPGPLAAAQAARAVEERQVDLLIGTQIVAKGWHFPHLTLVGVVDADLGLAGGDLRAAERTMQLLHQVAGRAGREERPGTVLLQTWQPDHPVMQAMVRADLEGFLQVELAQRRPGGWPPFGRLAALIVSAEQEAAADETARALRRAAPGGPGIQVLGPAPAPLALLRGRYRRRLLLRTARDIAAQPLLRDWLAQVAVPRGVRVAVDVDPISFL